MKCSYKAPEHKTSPRILVSNTMNCNCISTLESTSKVVKRLRQVFLLIKQSTPLFTSLLCHFSRFLNNNSASFFEPIVLSLKSSVLLTPCFCAFPQHFLLGAVYFRSYCTSVIFLLRFFFH